MLSSLRTLRRSLLLGLAALPLFASQGKATWSIVVCDTGTGEVCVASATCLANFDLQRFVPMILVGVGAAAAQSVVDVNAQNRAFIRARMAAGFSPRWILEALPSIDSQHQSRQYGIVSLEHHAMTWSGTGAGFARAGVNGNYVKPDGSVVRYAIQGNLLTGAIVVEAARVALVSTPGDLSQKVMAAMEAARRMGGDGRCSCSPGNPTGCGAPPADFDKSAHVAFIVLARPGDADGGCTQATGCASGDYYLSEQVITGTGGTDPVILLRGQYADWRQGLVGRPDHLLSVVTPQARRIPADGSSQTQVRVKLHDVEGDPLAQGGAILTIAWTGTGGPLAFPGAVTDHGGGVYSFPLTAGTTPGEGRWAIFVDDGLGAVRLWPDLVVSLE
jgi:hypothetical protein